MLGSHTGRALWSEANLEGCSVMGDTPDLP